MAISLSDYAWEIGNLTTISRADLHIALLMFLENVRLGYAKNEGLEKENIPDYASLQEELQNTTPDELWPQIRNLLQVFAIEHSELVEQIMEGDKESFITLFDETLEEVIAELGLPDEDTDGDDNNDDNDDGDEDDTEGGTYVAKIDTTMYETLAAAILAGNGEVITLLDNVTESITIDTGSTITIDLNGKTITNEDGNHTIYNKGTLEITGNGTVDNISHARTPLYNEVGGVVTLRGGNFDRSAENGISQENSGGNSYYTILNHGTMSIYDGVEVTQGENREGRYSSLVDNGWYDGTKNTTGALSTMHVYGGKFVGGLNTIKVDDYGYLTIDGGTFENSAQNTIMNNNVTVINGGTVSGDKIALYNRYLDDTMDQGLLTVNGGEFTGGTDCFQNVNGKITVTAGKFSSDPTLYLADGLEAVETDGMYEVKTAETTES